MLAKPEENDETTNNEEVGEIDTPAPPPPTTMKNEAAQDSSSSSSEEDDDLEDYLMSMLGKLNVAEDKVATEKPLLRSFDLSGVAEYIQKGNCKNVIVMVGAGISVSAGIPDFRTKGSGLYSKLEEYGLPHPEAIFELDFFKNNPKPFYTLAQELFPSGKYQPTPTHHFIKLLHDKGILLRCFSQNIDSLETLAGLPKEKLVAAHGNFDSATCIETGEKVPIDQLERAIFKDKCGWKTLRKKYGGLVKPDIVFFGEQLPTHFFRLVQEDFPKCDCLIVMGTSLVVQPFASLIGRVNSDCPRLLINREKVGTYSKRRAIMGMNTGGFRFDKSNYRDALWLGDCDNGVQHLSEMLGWEEDLKRLIDVK
jgi:NAD-dependent deacetylase sirtuin 2